jgi:hypothetical protein
MKQHRVKMQTETETNLAATPSPTTTNPKNIKRNFLNPQNYKTTKL